MDRSPSDLILESAWCKVNKGRAAVTNVTASGTISVPDVKTSRTVQRLWKDGAATSTQSSNSYANQGTCVSVTGISASGPTMSATVSVQCGKSMVKDAKDLKDASKDQKELTKDRKDAKDGTKEQAKERKDIKDRKEQAKEVKDVKEAGKERKDLKDRVETKWFDRDFTREGKTPKEFVERLGCFGQPVATDELAQVLADLEARMAALEAIVGMTGEAEPFIGAEQRPDLMGGTEYAAAKTDLQQRMAADDRDAKMAFDTMPPR
ncbi:MAG TPA: hypothetical protein VMU45_01205 [Candidatus Eisenbacteria bacterium]|nr:hypothetical protein [Candidatus Eisenbacteria bacterium]